MLGKFLSSGVAPSDALQTNDSIVYRCLLLHHQPQADPDMPLLIDGKGIKRAFKTPLNKKLLPAVQGMMAFTSVLSELFPMKAR
jgi:hypothetical protein